ncbi:hypothetical protein KY290_025939 [Solanum tuberosum]|uniref:Uncharacterized protein n=1 Tax=Solanum tuberosum TaxID=4113 RepID=A0ABQ7UUZ4_SOLTU|nr:hypothetical protein KY289_025017 [Solanum tuberosum]KAH0673668.1 hypothetical protein KY284_024755 [Solanum tuberosum]KAH0677001.1 hypothetical protein KY285_024802 [Solanum tuberosum]KAH0755669.1 hypothetical protein KY290_025939 [Solanum tuberosum]
MINKSKAISCIHLHSDVNEQNKKNAKSVRQEQQQVPNSIDNNNTYSDKGKQVVGSDTTH